MRRFVLILEALLLSALILACRSWNHGQVFVGDGVYFSDADCYSRMTRVQLCREHPGLILRHHDFENFPEGTVPHTTAPFDYLILAVSWIAGPFSANALDLAGAWVSPFLGVAGGLFLLFWTNRCGFRHRWPALLLYAFSPILVHGTELGRPDHQSLLIVLIIVAVCGEWILGTKPSRGWAIVVGLAWGMSLWVSLYEPLIIFLLVQALLFSLRRSRPLGENGAFAISKWSALLAVVLVGAAVERRLPSLSFFDQPFVRNWSTSIGELQRVPLFSLVWWQWGSVLLLLMPVAFVAWPSFRRATKEWLGNTAILLVLLGLLVLLTMWQARWGYFLMAIFVIVLPALLEPIRNRLILWPVYLLCLWPVAGAWDARLWPNEAVGAQRQEEMRERVELRQLASSMRAGGSRPFLAPWWLSPELAYWSGQPGVAGSSHESFPGILASARFFSATDWEEADAILRLRRVSLVVAYDGERVARTSERILGIPVSTAAICYRLDRSASQAGGFLQLISQNSSGKVYQPVNNR